MSKDLHNLSESELKDVIANAEKALKSREKGKRKEVMAQIRELAASIDVGIEIFDKDKVKRRGQVPAKYQNPNDLSQKWSGRGMRPNWLKTLLDEGRSIEDFEIQS